MRHTRLHKNLSASWKRTGCIVMLFGALMLGLRPGEREARAVDESQPTAAQALPPELAQVPGDAFAFVRLRVRDLWTGDLGHALRREFPTEASSLKQTAQKTLGVLQPGQVESLTIVLWTLPSLDGMRGPRAVGPRGAIEKKPTSALPTTPRTTDDKPDGPPPSEGSPLFRDQAEEAGSAPAASGGSAPGPGRQEGAAAREKEPLILAIATMTEKYDRGRVLKAILSDPEEQTYKDKTYYTSKTDRWKPAVYPVNERTLVLGTVSAMRRRLAQPVQRDARGPLGEALGLAAGKHQVVAGLSLSEKDAKALRKETEPQPTRYTLAALAVFRSLEPLLGARSAAVALDVSKESAADLRLHFADEAAARQGRAAAQDALVLLRVFSVGSLLEEARFQRADATDMKQEEQAVFWELLGRRAQTAARNADVKHDGKAVRVMLRSRVDLAALRAEAKTVLKAEEGDQGLRSERSRRLSRNNLKQIGLAMHNYHDTFGRFPAHAIYSKDGKPLLSWRVAILPFIEESTLYQQFNLDEPWDSEHNKKLLAQMPKIYVIPGVKTRERYATFYQAFVGKGAIFEDNLKITFATITDGTAHTMMIAEGAEAVPWTKPDDLDGDPGNPLPKLGVLKDGFHAVFADGSVRWVKKAIPGDILRALITRNGGEVVEYDKWVSGP